MCNYFVDFNLISGKYKMSISEIFAFINFNTDSLDDFISEEKTLDDFKIFIESHNESMQDAINDKTQDYINDNLTGG